MFFNKILLILLISIPLCYSIETIEATVQGTTIEVVKKQAFNVNIVESSSIRIGNSRQDSIIPYQISITEIKQTLVTLKFKKFNNLSINLGEERKVDFDSDNVFDVAIKLSALRPGRATLIFTSLESKVESLIDNSALIANEILNNTKETTPDLTKNVTNEEVELDINVNAEKSYFKINYIISTALIIILLAVILIHFLRRMR